MKKIIQEKIDALETSRRGYAVRVEQLKATIREQEVNIQRCIGAILILRELLAGETPLSDAPASTDATPDNGVEAADASNDSVPRTL